MKAEDEKKWKKWKKRKLVRFYDLKLLLFVLCCALILLKKTPVRSWLPIQLYAYFIMLFLSSLEYLFTELFKLISNDMNTMNTGRSGD